MRTYPRGRAAERFGALSILIAALTAPLGGEAEAGGPEPPLLTVDELRARFTEIRERGEAPTLDEFLALCRPGGVPAVAVKDQPEAYRAFLAVQDPPITAEDLILLHDSIRESIRDVRVVYDVRAVGVNRFGNKVDVTETQEFGLSQGRILFRRSGPGPDGVAEDRVMAYDGTAVRVALSRPDGVRHGSIDHYRGRQGFWDVSANPYLLTMMVDTARDAEMRSDFHDMMRLLRADNLGVLEETRVVDDVPCVVFGEPSVLLYLDPARNFALTRFEVFEFPPEGPARRKESREFSDFADLGNGIWLPRRIVSEELAPDGRVRLRCDVRVREWHVNEDLSEGYFSDVIPAGFKVIDSIRGTVFTLGRKESIDETLSSVIPVTRSGFSRWILIGGNVLIAVGVAACLILRGRPKEALP